MDAKHSRSGSPSQDPLPDIQALAEAVRAARRRHGLTQGDLAGLSGTGLRFIGELERGKPTVSLHKVVAVLAVLGLRLAAVDDTVP
ncbi:MAG: helix-turn-helix transcriptional regulator [Xanthomonadales bacterium]|nr:helix-turn-helix transcriptional regulator [Xanthomonadales bacterium]